MVRLVWQAPLLGEPPHWARKSFKSEIISRRGKHSFNMDVMVCPWLPFAYLSSYRGCAWGFDASHIVFPSVLDSTFLCFGSCASSHNFNNSS